MRALVQRVIGGHVTIDGNEVGAIEKGVVILLGITPGDTEKEADFLAEKIANLRIFPAEGSDNDWDESLLDKNYKALIVSQFTLYGTCNKGRRPDFNEAARPDISKPLYEYFVEKVKTLGISVETGTFGADMMVNLTNWGPATLWLEKNAN